MSNDQQPEEMRPIPDGGLKDAMPSWLKRPPAWRSMPTAEQRHERTLPEPDTSEIDPTTLVDISDLPMWLQVIAAREEVPLPQPDESVGHALQQLQAAAARSRNVDESPRPEAETVEPEVVEATATEAAATSETSEPASDKSPEDSTPASTSPSWLVWALVAAIFLLAISIVIIFTLL